MCGSYTLAMLEPLCMPGCVCYSSKRCLVHPYEVSSSVAPAQSVPLPPTNTVCNCLLNDRFGEEYDKLKGINSLFYCHVVTHA